MIDNTINTINNNSTKKFDIKSFLTIQNLPNTSSTHQQSPNKQKKQQQSKPSKPYPTHINIHNF